MFPQVYHAFTAPFITENASRRPRGKARISLNECIPMLLVTTSIEEW
jgi:hypothetical protein